MANKKFTDLLPADALPTLTGTDILAVTVDPNGATPVSNKTTIANLMGQAPVQSVNTATGAVVLDADDIDDTSTSHKFVTASDITNLSNLSGTNTGDQDLSSYQLQPSEGAFVDGDKTKLDGLNASDYASATHTHAIDDLSDVDTSTVGPTTNDFLNWDGSNWVPAVPTADVDTPLTTALRGTTNPHIGAYPNQSFKVIDNPYQSVMVVADEVGNLKLLNSLGVNNIAVGFSVVEDGVEPDIEVVSGSETYSVISGDSDSKGVNGLPLRQGFNNPDIGAYPAPILISGGTIA